MKIARAMGVEEVRGFPATALSGVGTQIPSFAESFDENLTSESAPRSTPGEVLKDTSLPCSTPSLLDPQRAFGKAKGNGGLTRYDQRIDSGKIWKVISYGLQSSELSPATTTVEGNVTTTWVSGSRIEGEGKQLLNKEEIVPELSAAANPSSETSGDNQEQSLIPREDAANLPEASSQANKTSILAPSEKIADTNLKESKHLSIGDKANKEASKTSEEKKAFLHREDKSDGNSDASIVSSGVVDGSRVEGAVEISLPESPKQAGTAGREDSSVSPAPLIKRITGGVQKTQTVKAVDSTKTDSISEKASSGTTAEAPDSGMHHATEKDKESVVSTISPVEKLHGEGAPLQQVSLSPITPPHTSTNAATDKTLASANPHTANAQHGDASSNTPLYMASEPQTVKTTPTSLEVGVPDGTHGWLKVRAELGGDGVVHASVSASSPSGTEMLRRELPSLTSYLHQEQVGVSSIAVHSPSANTSLPDMSGGAGHHRDMGSGTPDSHDGQRQKGSAMNHGQESLRAEVAADDRGPDWPSSMRSRSAGGWLSVRA